MPNNDDHGTGPDEAGSIGFDRLARKAGEDLRRPAPEGGALRIERRREQQLRIRALAGGGACAVLIAAIVGWSVLRRDDGTTRPVTDEQQQTAKSTGPAPITTIASTTTVAPTTTSSPTTTTVLSPEVQWAIDYTGGTPGPPPGTPVWIGISGDFDCCFDWESLDAVVNFMNSELGGIDGHPIEMIGCVDPTDIQGCADGFANEPVMLAVLDIGSAMTSALAGRKPSLLGSPDGGQHLGTGDEVFAAMALQIAKLTQPGDKVALLLGAFGSVDAAARLLPGRELIDVPGNVNADAFRAAGATDVQAVLSSTFASCTDVMAALSELRIEPVVVNGGGGACETATNWYDADHGYNLSTPDLESGALTLVQKMGEYGYTIPTNDANRQTFSVIFAGTLLVAARLVNELGGIESATLDALAAALLKFDGRFPGATGPSECNSAGLLAERQSPGSCRRFVGMQKWESGVWVDVAPIDLAAP